MYGAIIMKRDWYFPRCYLRIVLNNRFSCGKVQKCRREAK